MTAAEAVMDSAEPKRRPPQPLWTGRAENDGRRSRYGLRWADMAVCALRTWFNICALHFW